MLPTSIKAAQASVGLGENHTDEAVEQVCKKDINQQQGENMKDMENNDWFEILFFFLDSL